MPKPAMPEIPRPTTIDTSVCPLCGQSNACANEAERATGVPQGPCWCTTAVFTPELLARVPAEAQRLACICARCAAAAAGGAAKAPPPSSSI